jgi:hypothetical protein
MPPSLVGYVGHTGGGLVPRPGEDFVDALPGDVEGAAEFAFAGSCIVRFQHGLTEVLPGSVEALEGLVGDPKATDDLADLRLVAHLERILMQEYVPLAGRKSRFLGREEPVPLAQSSPARARPEGQASTRSPI